MEELVIGKRAAAEEATPVVAYRRPPDSLDDAYLSAEERADRIEKEFKAIAPMVAALTPHLYKSDRTVFDRQDQALEATLNQVQAQIIGLRMAADSEYAPTPWHVRLLLWTFSFIGWVYRVRQPIAKARNRHQARIDAADEYEYLAGQYRQQVSDIRSAKVNLRLEELLRKDGEYQQLMRSIPEVEKEIADSFTDIGKEQEESRLRSIKKRMSQIRQQTRTAALQEFGDEDL